VIAVSAELKARIQKLRGRYLIARVKIDYSDANIDNDVAAWSNGIARISSIAQIHNGREDVSSKWASLDGSWILDGTYKLAPETETELDNLEIGWWSEDLSIEDGSFVERKPPMLGTYILGQDILGAYHGRPELHVNFLPRTISNLRISFDNARNEYGVDFQIVIYDAAGNILSSISITGNSGLKYSADITPVNLAVEMKLVISKWSQGNRQAKVAEMFTAISETYEGRDILNMQILENRETPESGAIGQTVSGQCVISLVNKNRAFDYDNTTSKLYNVIRKRNRITAWIGDGTEWILMGTFFASVWDIAKRRIAITVTGLDRMADMDNSEFTTSTVIQSPADQSYLIDTYAEWAAGYMVGVVSDGNQIRMAIS
jgi:hypothetical protein